MQIEQRILVRGEEGEESAAVSAPDFDDPLRARLDARAEDPGSASGPRRIQDKEDCSAHVSLKAVFELRKLVLQPRAVFEKVVFLRRSVRSISFPLTKNAWKNGSSPLLCA